MVQAKDTPAQASQSLQYLCMFAVDLSKLLLSAYSNQFAKDIPQTEQRELIQSIEDGKSEGDLAPIVSIAYQLFKHFVVYELDDARFHVLTVIKDRIGPLMDQQERVSFFSQIIMQFLSRTSGGYSQTSVMDALDSLKIPAGDLIWFLSQRLGLSIEQDNQSKSKEDIKAPKRPMVLISTILVLALQQIKRQESRTGENENAERWAAFRKNQIDLIANKGPKKGQELNGSVSKKPDDQAKKSGEEGSEGSDSDDLIEELQPLGVQRSYSLPTSGPKGGQ